MIIHQSKIITSLFFKNWTPCLILFKKIVGKRNKFALLSLISEQSVNKKYFPIGRYTENQHYVRMISEVNGVKHRDLNLTVRFHVKHCCQQMPHITIAQVRLSIVKKGLRQ
ncbi:hypothetical protein FKX92_10685 [Streptococcus sanguinis]|uniref:Uncharacterized protein n=3 Tax=Streptococcus sanguinis TaxID=1305 RepID=F0IQE5_STRSA|nr:hypothetical protein HMPREF9382_1729 [Streptococcus sanguinis SK115]EGD39955.1 hypothetical protein HMPREF9384_0057 [Streptococcus sanguinis SK160]KAA0114788.1 hypothetical protein FKX92_10685 [Streptococcus sanguinis]